MANTKEPKIIGIPKSDWWPVTMYLILCGLTFVAISILLPSPLSIFAYVWIAVGQGFLVKQKAIAKPYPITILGCLLSFAMAAAWPYYCHFKKR